MAAERVMCKQCGETDSNKLIFSDDRHSIFCKVCRTTTSLVDVVVHEHIGEVKLDGVQGFEEQLNNANNLLRLKDYEEAGKQFKELTVKYSTRYETWFGLARAESKDFAPNTLASSNASIHRLLDHAASCGQHNEKVIQIVNEAKTYYDQANALQENADQANVRCEALRRLYRDTSKDQNSIHDCQSKIEGAEKERMNSVLQAAVTFVLLVADFYIFGIRASSPNHTTGLIDVICVFAFIGLLILFIKKLIALASSVRRTIRTTHEKNKMIAECSETIAAFTAHNKQVEMDVTNAAGELKSANQELEKHIGTYAQLSSNWS